MLSHDVWAPSDLDPTEPGSAFPDGYTLGWTAGEQIAIAETRGLDFLAVTDHDTTDALRGEDYRSDRLTLVPGYEHSLRGGHVGVFVPDRDLVPDIIRDVDGSKDFVDDDALARFLDLDASLGFDAVEVWNIHWLTRHDILPFADSDNHWRSTTAAQGVGQPTTWVFAADRSPAAILDAVRAGRTTISAQPPHHGGALLTMHADEDFAGGRSAMLGGSVRSEGAVHVTIKVERGSGNLLRLISSGMVVASEPVVSPASEHHFEVVLPRGGWLRAEFLVDPSYREPTTDPLVTYGHPLSDGRFLPLARP